MNDQQDDPYICVGICMTDPESGYCQGCGRPPLDSPAIVAELIPLQPVPASNTNPDIPE